MVRKIQKMWEKITSFFVVFLLFSVGAVNVFASSNQIPQIRLTYDEAALSKDEFIAGTFSITYSDGTSSTFDARFRLRGSATSDLPKKSLAVKFKQKAEDGTSSKLNVQFFNMREDNYWILDASAEDPSRLRNMAMFSLWLDFSAKPYWFGLEPNALNGNRGEWVEVTTNNKYVGIYQLRERVDRKQLKLKKVKEGVLKGTLIKGTGGSLNPFYLCETEYDNNSSMWKGWKMQYPDLEEGEPIDWSPLVQAYEFVGCSSKEEFQQQVTSYFDIPVVRDYMIFLNVFDMPDAAGNNVFLSIYNREESNKISFTPWDLDMSLGWFSNKIGINPRTDPRTDTEISSLNHLFRRLETEYDGWNESVAERYRQLRKTYFSYDNIVHYFTDAYNYLQTNGAWEREKTLGYKVGKAGYEVLENIDFEYELNYIKNWLKERLKYMDEFYANEHISTEIEEVTLDNLYEKLWSNDADGNTQAYLYTITGQTIQTISNGNTDFLQYLKPGIYILRYKTQVYKLKI